MSYIAAIEVATPEYCHTQEAITAFYERTTEDLQVRRKIRSIAQKSGIETRYSVLQDFSADCADYTFFSKNKDLEPAPTMRQRMQLFRTEALKLSLKAILQIPNFDSLKADITHIITVTCTGLFTPGLEIELIRALNLPSSTKRNPVNFMGCNAAVIAVDTANAICSSHPNAKVLIVCTELCTLHFQKNYTDDYILSTALFGDGSAAMIVQSQQPEMPYYQNLEIIATHSYLIDNGYNDMAWEITEDGFIMNLSSYVSQLINGELPTLFQSLSIYPTTINHWAVHPGGRKILDEFSSTLAVSKDQLSASYKILQKYGNMSSATILFVLKEVIESNRIQVDENCFITAFGPGLSIESFILKHV